MGLDITAYCRLEPAPEAELEDGRPVEWDKYFQPGAGLAWAEEQWPGRCYELQPDAVYSFKAAFGLRAGSYSGYNLFRSQLAKLAGFRDIEDYWANATPENRFYPLINFADNEGVLGAAVCTRLKRDFAACQEQANLVDSDWFLELYEVWRKALRLAADGGALSFH